MVKLFTARELADCLGINPAKWKRWVREFLPPDPLAGMQSGYARQFYVNDAFTVFLAGHLVAALKFSIPDARTILEDLSPWMQRNGFRFNPDGTRDRNADPAPVRDHTIIVRSYPDGGFGYTARGLVSRTPAVHDGADVFQEVIQEVHFGKRADDSARSTGATAKLIEITRLCDRFLELVDPNHAYFNTN